MDNGGIESGDGWRFRGRGLKQLTGRDNYTRFTRDYPKIWSEHIDFVSNPDLLHTNYKAVAQNYTDATPEFTPLSREQIKKALTVPALHCALSRLLIQYESEWHSDDGLTKWHALDKLLGYDELEECYQNKSTTNLQLETIVNNQQVTPEEAVKLCEGIEQHFMPIWRKRVYLSSHN